MSICFHPVLARGIALDFLRSMVWEVPSLFIQTNYISSFPGKVTMTVVQLWTSKEGKKKLSYDLSHS
jgi:hypothetical protein